MKTERREVTTESKKRIIAEISQEQIAVLEKLFEDLKELIESVRQEDASAALAAYVLGYSIGALWVHRQLVRAAPKLGPRLVEWSALAVKGSASSLKHVPRNRPPSGRKLWSAINNVMLFWDRGLQLVSSLSVKEEDVGLDNAPLLTEIVQENWNRLESLVLQAVPPDSLCHPLIRIGITVRKEQMRQWAGRSGSAAAEKYLVDLARDLILLPSELRTDLFPDLRPITDPATGPGLLRMMPGGFDVTKVDDQNYVVKVHSSIKIKSVEFQFVNWPALPDVHILQASKTILIAHPAPIKSRRREIPCSRANLLDSVTSASN